MTLLTFVTWIVVALGTAWGASAVMKSGGHGLKADVLLGLTGSGSACVIVWITGMFAEPGIVATVVVAAVGAAAVIALQRRFFSAPLANVHIRTGRR